MYNSIKLATSILIAACACSCGNNADQETIEDSFPESVTLIDDEQLKAPIFITATESGIAVVNKDIADTLVDVFNKKGEMISRFLTQGNGPDEVLKLLQLQYDLNNGTFYAIDYKNSSILKVDNWSINSPQISKLAKFETPNNQDAIDVNATEYLIAYSMGVMNGGEIVTTNATNSGMLAVFNNDLQLKDVIVPYPDKNKTNPKLTDWANIELYKPNVNVSPDGKFAMVDASVADVRIFLTYKGDSIAYKKFEDVYPNDIYIIQSGADFVQGAITPKSKIHALSTSLSNNLAYQLYSGATVEEMNASEFTKDTRQYGSNLVRVFDKEGRLARNIHLDQMAKAIAVSPDDSTLYTLTESSQFGNRILKYEL